MFCVSLKIRFVKLSSFIWSAQSPGCILILRKTDDERLGSQWFGASLAHRYEEETFIKASYNIVVFNCLQHWVNTGISHENIKQRSGE